MERTICEVVEDIDQAVDRAKSLIRLAQTAACTNPAELEEAIADAMTLAEELLGGVPALTEEIVELDSEVNEISGQTTKKGATHQELLHSILRRLKPLSCRHLAAVDAYLSLPIPGEQRERVRGGEGEEGEVAGKASVLDRILAYCPDAQGDFGEATSEVYTTLTNEIEGKGLECLAATCEFVRAWPGCLATAPGREKDGAARKRAAV